MNAEKQEKLQELKVDDESWYVYIFIVIAALYSNHVERDYTFTHDKKEFQTYHTINIIVLSIAFFIYLYFLYVNSKHFEKKRNFENALTLIGTCLLLASGALLLISEIRSSSSGDDIPLGF